MDKNSLKVMGALVMVVAMALVSACSYLAGTYTRTPAAANYPARAWPGAYYISKVEKTKQGYMVQTPSYIGPMGAIWGETLDKHQANVLCARHRVKEPGQLVGEFIENPRDLSWGNALLYEIKNK